MSSEIRKRKKGQVLNSNERQLILNLISYLKGKHADKSISQVIKEISKATGCSERTIYKIRKDADKGIMITANRTKLRKKENKNSRNIKYDSFVKSSIRKKVYNFILQNVPPTLNGILSLVNQDPELPNFKRSTLHTLLKEIGFIYQQIGKKSLLTERSYLVKFRQEYLKSINKFREENRWIIYTGETLISSSLKNESVQYDILQEHKTISNNNQSEAVNTPLVTHNVVNATIFITAPPVVSDAALIYTIDTGALALSPTNTMIMLNENQGTKQDMAAKCINLPIKVVTKDIGNEMEAISSVKTSASESPQTKNFNGKSLSLKLFHACCDQGFIKGAEHLVLCKKDNLEAECYENWLIKKLLPKIPANSVVVTDINSSCCYKDKGDDIPNNYWKKQQIKNWLHSENMNIGDAYHKKELLTLVSNMKPFSGDLKSKIAEMVKEKGVKIIGLPPFHYELNPLNMVWAQIKNYVKLNCKSFKSKKIKEAIKEGMNSIEQTNWMNHLNSVRQAEELLKSVDSLQKQS